MAADAGMAPRPLRRALLGSGRRPVGPLAPRRPPGGRDAGRAAERRRTAQAGQQAGSRAFRDCHTRRPRAPYPVSAAWALIGRDLDSRVLIGVAKCSSLPPPALACNARSPPASKDLESKLFESDATPGFRLSCQKAANKCLFFPSECMDNPMPY
ncbi:uncharacterized protein LOC112604458 isoform X2 [Theropithecus gelada]|uniref:uncharacterized protein LOC112604458 isoform X2 n=1 Tax=Theropithecus gelada TaxID=9565 RepID=UPI000DC15B7D|nr:uncharacterized protein LOC112604458 isoform X2 [Theropithecus gelada]